MREDDTTTDDGPAEVWAPIPGYEGFYEASTLGNIRSLDRTVTSVSGALMSYSGQVLNPWTDQSGRRMVVLSKDGQKRYDRVYRLVAQAHLLNPENKREVNHKDGDPSNDAVVNLEFCTRAENMAHAFENGLCFGGHERVRGEGHPKAKLTERDVLEAREMAKTDRTAAARSLMDKGVKTVAAYDALSGRTWKHLPL